MSGHFICEHCGHEDPHADFCRCLRPRDEQWKGNRTKQEMEAIRALKLQDGGKKQ